MPDPDPETRGGGGGGGGGGRSSRPLDEGGTGPPKIFFLPFWPRFGLKIRGCGPPLDLQLARLIFNVLRSDFQTSLQSVIFITLAAS